MGSSGSGRFGDYPSGGNGTQGKPKGGNGGKVSEEINCPKTIDLIKLEDVATSDYYQINNRTVPPANTIVHLKKGLHKGRLVIEEPQTHIVIGNLPTKYNYLVYCMVENDYLGEVLSSGLKPIPFVTVKLYV